MDTAISQQKIRPFVVEVGIDRGIDRASQIDAPGGIVKTLAAIVRPSGPPWGMYISPLDYRKTSEILS